MSGIASLLLGLWDRYFGKYDERVFVLVGVSCLIFASYSAWRDQYVRDQGQITYIQFDESGDKVPRVPLLASGQYAGLNLVTSNVGQYRADDSYTGGVIEIRTAASRPSADELGESWLSTPSIEKEVWGAFLKRSKKAPWRRAKVLVVPGQSETAYSTATSDHALTQPEIDEIMTGKKIMYVLALAVWTDAAGTHERRICRFFHFPIAQATNNVLEACSQYNDFLPKALD